MKPKKTVSIQNFFWNCFVSVSFRCADSLTADWKLTAYCKIRESELHDSGLCHNHNIVAITAPVKTDKKSQQFIESLLVCIDAAGDTAV